MLPVASQQDCTLLLVALIADESCDDDRCISASQLRLNHLLVRGLSLLFLHALSAVNFPSCQYHTSHLITLSFCLSCIYVHIFGLSAILACQMTACPCVIWQGLVHYKGDCHACRPPQILQEVVQANQQESARSS